MNYNRVMKTAALLLVIPVVFASCKRDFTCTCKSTNVLGVESTEVYSLENQTRPDAVENCENYERANGFSTRNCNL